MTSRAGQGGFSNWQELRDHAIDLFNETPHPATEQEIIEAYELHPDAVAKAIDSIAVDVQTGAARSGWGVLRARAASIKAPPSNPDRSSSLNREKQVARAEQWVRAAGIHLDRTDEILDYLFGDLGQLREYAQVDLERTGPPDTFGQPTWKQTDVRGDTGLAERILDLWHNNRPTGMQIERDAEARAESWKQRNLVMAESLAAVKAKRDEQQAVTVPPTATEPPPEIDYSQDLDDDPELQAVPADSRADDDIPF